MKPELMTLCEAFAANREMLRQSFKWEHDALLSVCANIFTARGLTATEERLKAARDMLKAETGPFSNFRGTGRLAFISLLAASREPEALLARSLRNYEALKGCFHRSEYLALGAAVLADMAPEDDPERRALAGRSLYERMKAEHRFLTSAEDSVFALLLTFSDKSEDALILEMEESYRALKERFSGSNAVQAASHVLCLGEGGSAKRVAALLALFDGFAARGRRYGKYYELPILAALSVLDVEPAAAVEDVLAIDGAMAGLKGYRGLFGLDKKTRLSHAAMLAADAACPGRSMEAAALTGTVAMIAAQQAAMCAVIASTSATSAAAAT